LGGKTGKYPGIPAWYLLEGFYVIATVKSAKSLWTDKKVVAAKNDVTTVYQKFPKKYIKTSLAT